MNVIWVISDSLRCDHVGVYGNQEIMTPSLDSNVYPFPANACEPAKLWL